MGILGKAAWALFGIKPMPRWRKFYKDHKRRLGVFCTCPEPGTHPGDPDWACLRDDAQLVARRSPEARAALRRLKVKGGL